MQRLALALTPLLALPATAGTILVPSEQPSIQEAINVASNGDVVLVSPGSWDARIDFRGKAVTVDSVAGYTKTVIDATGADFGIRFIAGEGPDSVLRGFTIRGASGGLMHDGLLCGGGIHIVEASPTIEDCVIEECHAQMGGGMSLWQSNAVLRDVTFRNNTAQLDGGGLRIHHLSQPTLEGCAFEQNLADIFGGGIAYGNDSDGWHIDCTFEGNAAGIRGGAISKTCDCSGANIQNSDFCNSFPDHILGWWNDHGGNALCPLCANDVTQDGQINVNDVLAIIDAWGGCVCVEDINGDSAVNVNDLLLILESWGPCPG